MLNCVEANKEKQDNFSSLDVIDWRDLTFSHPERTVNLATLFSGIGSIEQAFKRLKIKHNIVFAGDIDPFVKQSYFDNWDSQCKSLNKKADCSLPTHRANQVEKWRTDAQKQYMEKFKNNGFNMWDKFEEVK